MAGALPNLQTVARGLGGEINGAQVLCPGPGHSAADRSLSVKIDASAPDGFVVNTFSPADDPIVCKDYVREKLGLPAFKPNGDGRRRASGDTIERMLMAAVGAQTYNEKPKGKLVAQYDYRNADGMLAYQVLRYEPKNFSQRRPNGKGRWIWKLEEQRVLYRWPELLKFPDGTIFITEGEKDADRVADLGHCATTVAGGKWTADCVKALAGRDVVILEDNDDAGRKKALAVAQALHGTAKTIRIVSLPGLPNKGDVSDWLDADPQRADKFVEVCFDMPEWRSGPADTKTEIPVENKSADKLPLPFINIAAWHDQPVPERVWTVKDRIPASNVALLSGEGSVGKSILALHLAAAVVLGRDWLGTMPEVGAALVVCCEDDETELWRRLDLIFAYYGAAYTEFKDMHLIALAGQETLMAAPDRNGLIQSTKLFERIREAACDIRPKLIVLDNSADIYGGNENDRAQVRQFIGILRGMAIAAGAGVLLTSHPSLTGISTGTGLSGSTAWNASVRSRLYFKRAVTDRDEEPDPDLRVLEVMKNNYGPVGETMNLRWKNGLFLPVGGVTNLEKLAAEQVAEQLFLTLLDQFNGQGRNLSDKQNAPNYAPTVFANDKQARERGIKKAAFKVAMNNLFAAGKICLEPYGPPSRGTSKLAYRK
jgi:RecA-family ATPase